ncbi:helix-turn-helix transcriptional regulator [Deinococcus sp. 6GRE01]|nr:helix-turn-helix transcriptional regulator [Deinococcus sp. 6GRE01]
MTTLKHLRKAAKLSGESVAQLVGVTKTTYYLWEWGKVMPGGENLAKLESVLPGSINALVSMKAARPLT